MKYLKLFENKKDYRLEPKFPIGTEVVFKADENEDPTIYIVRQFVNIERYIDNNGISHYYIVYDLNDYENRRYIWS